MTPSRTTPDKGVTRYAYDASGNPNSQTDAKKITKTCLYDDLNRLTDIDCPDAAQNIAYGYDQDAYGKGRLTSVIFPGDVSALTCNADGKTENEVICTDSRTFETGYTYHPFGLLKSMTILPT